MKNREHKYRVWYGKEFVYFKLGEVNKYPSNVMDFPVHDFTGLKDRYEKEIYEGDIVKINGYGINNLITDIYWDECTGGFYSRNLYESDTFEHSSSCIEVIGNIYETPELLK